MYLIHTAFQEARFKEAPRIQKEAWNKIYGGEFEATVVLLLVIYGH